eukprot:scaffold2963_cov250-Pinguiococcus_pyrenoidosus.AAC.28
MLRGGDDGRGIVGALETTSIPHGLNAVGHRRPTALRSPAERWRWPVPPKASAASVSSAARVLWPPPHHRRRSGRRTRLCRGRIGPVQRTKFFRTVQRSPRPWLRWSRRRLLDRPRYVPVSKSQNKRHPHWLPKTTPPPALPPRSGSSADSPLRRPAPPARLSACSCAREAEHGTASSRCRGERQASSASAALSRGNAGTAPRPRDGWPLLGWTAGTAFSLPLDALFRGGP